MYQSVKFLGKIFGAKSHNFSKIFLNLSQFWLKFGKILKDPPFIYQIWHFISSHSYYQEADFATHAGGAPGRVLKLFCDGVWGPSSETPTHF